MTLPQTLPPTLPQLREPPRPTTTVRADELAPGDQLTIGETVTSIEADDHGDNSVQGVVHVYTEQYPTWALLFSVATKVRIYDRKATTGREKVGG